MNFKNPMNGATGFAAAVTGFVFLLYFIAFCLLYVPVWAVKFLFKKSIQRFKKWRNDKAVAKYIKDSK